VDETNTWMVYEGLESVCTCHLYGSALLYLYWGVANT